MARRCAREISSSDGVSLIPGTHAYPDMGAVETLRADAIEVAHALRQIDLGDCDKEVVMIGHLVPGMVDSVQVLADLSKYF